LGIDGSLHLVEEPTIVKIFATFPVFGDVMVSPSLYESFRQIFALTPLGPPTFCDPPVGKKKKKNALALNEKNIKVINNM